MTHRHPFRVLLCLAILSPARSVAAQTPATDLSAAKPGRDPGQAVDESYTRKIHEYTTESFFLSPLVDYLPASATVPTPQMVLGDIAGAKNNLPYSKDVYAYFRLLEKSTPRVKVFSIGTTEEGREMIAVAVASDSLIAHLDENKAKLAKLADPRSISMNDAEADRIASSATPVYYITGTIHSPESGAPTALMELAYRLAVDESPYVKNIRDHLITLITPIVEVDGRDREVDIFRWHMAHPDQGYLPLVYWGHYVGHDNNRDAMGLTLKLSTNVLDTYLGWKAQLLHDLHESVPYLYDNTIGDGPYNAWLDPLLTNEWQMLGWNNVQEMTRFGMPGVFAHGNFDTWSPGYLMFMAATHNGISRLYETFGNGGTAETMLRTLTPEQTSRTWYRQDPPLPRVMWSLRDNNNYEETGLLVSLNYFANNRRLFLQNFWEKSKRSVLKARTEGPAAYVFPSSDTRPGAQAELMRLLQKQHVEISRATAPFTVMVQVRRPPTRPGASDTTRKPTFARTDSSGPSTTIGADSMKPPVSSTTSRDSVRADTTQPQKPRFEPRTFPAGSYIVRMDQPYSRIADALLDYQFWSPNDPQKTPYDDTGWTFPENFAVQSVRVTDVKVLDVPMEAVMTEIRAPGGVDGSGAVFAINNNGDNSLATLRYRFPKADFQIAEQPFSSGGHSFGRGSFIISGVSAGDLAKATAELGLRAYGLTSAPSVAKHPARAARVAILHTWTSTQTEGWWRQAFDFQRIPFDYISVQDVARNANLRDKYDVILFPPGGGGVQGIISGLPMWGAPMPWKKTPLTPNIGTIAQTDDMRPGLGYNGVDNLKKFVEAGGVLVTVSNTANFAIATGLTNGVTMTNPPNLHVVGSLLRTKIVDEASPIMYGIRDSIAVYSDGGESFNISNILGGKGGPPKPEQRATGRGTASDPDVIQGRAVLEPRFEAPLRPKVQPWQAVPVTDEQLRNPLNVIPPALRPRVVLRFAGQSELLVSGLLDGNDVAQRAVVVDAPLGKGHVVMFGNNPIYRGSTIGSYFMVYNTLLNWDNLGAGRKLDLK